MISDEGFTDEDGMEHTPPPSPFPLHQPWMNELSDAQRQGQLDVWCAQEYTHMSL